MKAIPVVFSNFQEQVEKVTKVCTDAPITGSDIFAKRLWGMEHYTPFEHNSFTCLEYENPVKEFVLYCQDNNYYQPAFRINANGNVVGSFRAWAEHLKLGYSDLLPLVQWENSTRLTFFITTNIGIAREIIRHREMSFMERSTRYVKTFNWLPTLHDNMMDKQFQTDIEVINLLAKKGLKRDTYREILPLGTETHLYVTGFEDQWEDFIYLRAEKAAHPSIQVIANQIKKELEC